MLEEEIEGGRWKKERLGPTLGGSTEEQGARCTVQSLTCPTKILLAPTQKI